MLRTGAILWLLCALLFAPLTGSAAISAYADPCLSITSAQETEITATVKVAVLNVRDGPGTNYRVLSQVLRGTRLIVLDWTDRRDWLKVRTPVDMTGWVSAPLVDLDSSPETPQPSTRASPVSQSRPGNSFPAYATMSFRPNTVTNRQAYVHECFGAGDSPLRVVSANTPVQVVGKADYVPPSEESVALGQGTFLKIRLWDGQYAWILADTVQIDVSGVSNVSNQCETYDRIDWTKVVRPTPTPTSQPGAGGRSSGCCKICRTGKACGNTCIARWKTCHVGPGCACNG